MPYMACQPVVRYGVLSATEAPHALCAMQASRLALLALATDLVAIGSTFPTALEQGLLPPAGNPNCATECNWLDLRDERAEGLVLLDRTIAHNHWDFDAARDLLDDVFHVGFVSIFRIAHPEIWLNHLGWTTCTDIESGGLGGGWQGASIRSMHALLCTQCFVSTMFSIIAD